MWFGVSINSTWWLVDCQGKVFTESELTLIKKRQWTWCQMALCREGHPTVKPASGAGQAGISAGWLQTPTQQGPWAITRVQGGRHTSALYRAWGGGTGKRHGKREASWVPTLAVLSYSESLWTNAHISPLIQQMEGCTGRWLRTLTAANPPHMGIFIPWGPSQNCCELLESNDIHTFCPRNSNFRCSSGGNNQASGGNGSIRIFIRAL